MLGILAVGLGIAAIVGIHEACHMTVSKLFGVKVLKFSLGFGPVLFSKKIKDTSYELAILPLGGYISMAGDNPEESIKNGFFSLPWWKRALIALAGPVANLLLGFVMIFGLLVFFRGWPIVAGLERAYQISSFVVFGSLKAISGMVTHTVPASSLSGPIMVTKILTASLSDGIVPFMLVLAVISLSLGLFNLFPVPGLDGGHVLLYFLEGIRGKKFSSKVYTIWGYVGIILLISLMLFTCFLDIVKLLK